MSQKDNHIKAVSIFDKIKSSSDMNVNKEIDSSLPGGFRFTRYAMAIKDNQEYYYSIVIYTNGDEFYVSISKVLIKVEFGTRKVNDAEVLFGTRKVNDAEVFDLFKYFSEEIREEFLYNLELFI